MWTDGWNFESGTLHAWAQKMSGCELSAFASQVVAAAPQLTMLNRCARSGTERRANVPGQRGWTPCDCSCSGTVSAAAPFVSVLETSLTAKTKGSLAALCDGRFEDRPLVAELVVEIPRERPDDLPDHVDLPLGECA